MAKLWLDKAFTAAVGRLNHTRIFVQRRRDEMAAGDVPSSVILGLYGDLRRAKAELQDYASVSGIGAYAQEQFSDPSLDVGASFNGTMTEIDNVVAWVQANFPTATQGGTQYLAARVFDGSGDVAERQFTPSQTAGLRTELDALVTSTDWII